mmetsp:Transcript_7016/g.20999  ORF Transcript_7016/g.20999 Transcript_7016/m.20999 type:complete len:257 (-) Transcript_7016:1114-1884(-)
MASCGLFATNVTAWACWGVRNGIGALLDAATDATASAVVAELAPAFGKKSDVAGGLTMPAVPPASATWFKPPIEKRGRLAWGLTSLREDEDAVTVMPSMGLAEDGGLALPLSLSMLGSIPMVSELRSKVCPCPSFCLSSLVAATALLSLARRISLLRLSSASLRLALSLALFKFSASSFSRLRSLVLRLYSSIWALYRSHSSSARLSYFSRSADPRTFQRDATVLAILSKPVLRFCVPSSGGFSSSISLLCLWRAC